jgi:hypothetical protein
VTLAAASELLLSRGMMAMGPAWGAGGAEDGAVWAQSAGMAMRAAIERQREARRAAEERFIRRKSFKSLPRGLKPALILLGQCTG